MSDLADRDLLLLLLEDVTMLTDREADAFAGMLEDLDNGKWPRLTKAQREWAVRVAEAHDLYVEPAVNLHSAGKVPQGIATKKTRGEAAAAELLARPLPKSPPRRPA